LTYKKIVALCAFVIVSVLTLAIPKTETYAKPPSKKLPFVTKTVDTAITADLLQVNTTKITEVSTAVESTEVDVNTVPKADQPALLSKTDKAFSVPFYSQFADITSPQWQKVGCGIASLAMLIDFYRPGEVVVDDLLSEGISTGAYISDAGWSHAGLINLSKQYGLTGASRDMAGSTMDDAFSKLESVLEEGPVMVSVHYTFDPKNPIPHLVVVSGVEDGKVYYNDPAEKAGSGSLSIAKFQSAWKKRYIEIRNAL
jgi:predicted double-glycine peptidase